MKKQKEYFVTKDKNSTVEKSRRVWPSLLLQVRGRPGRGNSRAKDLKVSGCLCEKCDNFQHLLRRMSKLTEKNVPLSCKCFCEEFEDGVAVEELLKDVDEEEVSFRQWRKVQEELTSYKSETDDGKVKRVKTTRVVDRTKLVTISLKKNQF